MHKTEAVDIAQDTCRPFEREGKLPPARGLYDPRYEHDACGIGFVAHIEGRRSHSVLQMALEALANHSHRGAVADDLGMELLPVGRSPADGNARPHQFLQQPFLAPVVDREEVAAVLVDRPVRLDGRPAVEAVHGPHPQPGTILHQSKKKRQTPLTSNPGRVG